MTRPKPKGKARGARARVPSHGAAEDRLFGQLQAVLADAAKRRELSAVEVVGVLTAVTHDVLANVWAQAREQRAAQRAG